MNWEAIGAIGEVLGAFGVIVTLAYLATQIKQSNRVGTATSEFHFRSMAQNVNRIITDIPDGDLFLEKLLEEDPDFSPAHRAKALMFSRSLLNLWAFADTSFRNQLIDDIAYQASIDDFSSTLNEYPGMAEPLADLVKRYKIDQYGEISPMWKELTAELQRRGYLRDDA